MGYSILKILHLFSVIVFMGNITIGIFWLRFALKTRDFSIIHHTIKGIIKADRIFTIPSVSILIIAGIGAAMHGGYSIFGTGWILWSLVLVLISGFAFSAMLAPIQRKIRSLTEKGGIATESEWLPLMKLVRQWNIWGFVAWFTPLLALLMMIMKHPR